jgi:hypothetical protein
VDFFERYLGISPDGGDGSAELLFLVVLFAIIALIAWRLLGLPNVKDDAHASVVFMPFPGHGPTSGLPSSPALALRQSPGFHPASAALTASPIEQL